MKISMKRAISVVVAIIFISMCCSIKSYAISMDLELSGDNIVFSKGVYVCSKKIPVGGKMNIKAEYVTSNEMSPAPTGEVSREDVSSQCTWKSSNGVIEGISEGRAEITATYKERSATVSLAVGEDRLITTGDNISIVQKDNIKTVEKGKNLQLDIEGVESLTNVKNEDVTWSSSDEKIATVDKSGLVTAIANGNVTIKAEYMSYSSTYDITVTDYEEDGYYNITLNKDKIQLGVGNTDVIEITAKTKDGVVRNCRS